LYAKSQSFGFCMPKLVKIWIFRFPGQNFQFLSKKRSKFSSFLVQKGQNLSIAIDNWEWEM